MKLIGKTLLAVSAAFALTFTIGCDKGGDDGPADTPKKEDAPKADDAKGGDAKS